MTRAPMPGQDLLEEPLRSRWSISVYDDQHTLTRDQIESLLSAARWSPSAGNSQPWRFIVAERGSHAHGVLVRHLSRGNSGWVPRASVVFIAIAQVAQDPDGNGPQWPTYSFYDLGQAAAHLSVQASLIGLRVHQFAGFDHAAVGAELGVPEWFQVMTGIAVGLPGDPADVDPRDAEREQRVRARRPLAEIAFTDGFGKPWG